MAVNMESESSTPSSNGSDADEYTSEVAVIIGAASCAKAAMLTIVDSHVQLYARQPNRTRGLSRSTFIESIIRSSNTYCISQLRMTRVAFYKLCSILRMKGDIGDTRWMTLEEQVVMFLHTLGHNVKNRVIGHRFIRSDKTISCHFNKVLNAVIKLYSDYLQLPNPETPVEVAANPKFAPYFQDCIGALDGTHVPAFIPFVDQADWRDRKGDVSQNVLAACSFDCKFVYVLAGWEGCSSDARVLQSAIQRIRDRLTAPEGKYYVVDAGYAHTPEFMAPYRGVWYHLNEYRSGQQRRDKKELFNYGHVQLRNAIERCFGILKGRFPILKTAPQYPFSTQVKIVLACCVLHNFIRANGCEDGVFDGEEEDEPIERDGWVERQFHEFVTPQQRGAWKAKRNEIADRMWADYLLERCGGLPIFRRC